jgi:hypothetical protein
MTGTVQQPTFWARGIVSNGTGIQEDRKPVSRAGFRAKNVPAGMAQRLRDLVLRDPIEDAAIRRQHEIARQAALSPPGSLRMLIERRSADADTMLVGTAISPSKLRPYAPTHSPIAKPASNIDASWKTLDACDEIVLHSIANKLIRSIPDSRRPLTSRPSTATVRSAARPSAGATAAPLIPRGGGYVQRDPIRAAPPASTRAPAGIAGAGRRAPPPKGPNTPPRAAAAAPRRISLPDGGGGRPVAGGDNADDTEDDAGGASSGPSSPVSLLGGEGGPAWGGGGEGDDDDDDFAGLEEMRDDDDGEDDGGSGGGDGGGGGELAADADDDDDDSAPSARSGGGGGGPAQAGGGGGGGTRAAREAALRGLCERAAASECVGRRGRIWYR